MVDQIIFAGDDAGSALLQKGGILNGDFSFYIAGFAVYLIVGLTAIYTIFLLTLSRIALSILLVLGPLFIALLFFETTKRFFEAWIAQMANYAFITILTVLVATLMLTLLSTAAQQAVGAGGGITIAHAVRVCMAAGLTFLVMRQVMPMAAGLASGLALSTFGAFGAALAWGMGSAMRSTGQFTRGALIDQASGRYDSLARRSGYQLRRGVLGRSQPAVPRLAGEHDSGGAIVKAGNPQDPWYCDRWRRCLRDAPRRPARTAATGKLEPINAVTPKGSTGPQTLPPAPNAARWEAR